MKSYTITVNGNVYDVTVEEKNVGAIATAPRKAVAPVVAQPTPAVRQVTPVVESAPQAQGSVGEIKVTAGAAGKVFRIEASVGQSVKAGDPVVIIEAMKMEIPVVSPKDGTVASIDVSVGDPVEAGTVLATLN